MCVCVCVCVVWGVCVRGCVRGCVCAWVCCLVCVCVWVSVGVCVCISYYSDVSSSTRIGIFESVQVSRRLPWSSKFMIDICDIMQPPPASAKWCLLAEMEDGTAATLPSEKCPRCGTSASVPPNAERVVSVYCHNANCPIAFKIVQGYFE